MGYYVGDVLSYNPNMVNGCEEAVIAKHQPNNSEPYSLLFFQHSSITGYHFTYDTRVYKMLANAYVDCINPHFCYLKNLYSVLAPYKIKILGYQAIYKTSTMCLYLKVDDKFLQIFIPDENDLYKSLYENGMFVYIYEAEHFDDLKLHQFGEFMYYTRLQHYVDIWNVTTGLKDAKGILFENMSHSEMICSIEEWEPDCGKGKNGFQTFTSNFSKCKDLNEFKSKIL